MTEIEFNTWAVIPAAGASQRMGELTREVSKVLLPVGYSGKPLLSYTVSCLAASQSIAGYAIAARTHEFEIISEMVSEIVPDAALILVEGGTTRQESVHAAVRAVPDSVDFVAVHDAARAFCRVDLVTKVIRAAHHSGAAILAIPSNATLKQVAGELIQATIDRSSIWEAQTPQVARREVLLAAYQKAVEDGFIATDDSQLLERCGVPVSVVIGAGSNIKITRPEDLEFAEWLLSRR